MKICKFGCGWAVGGILMILMLVFGVFGCFEAFVRAGYGVKD